MNVNKFQWNYDTNIRLGNQITQEFLEVWSCLELETKLQWTLDLKILKIRIETTFIELPKLQILECR